MTGRGGVVTTWGLDGTPRQDGYEQSAVLSGFTRLPKPVMNLRRSRRVFLWYQLLANKMWRSGNREQTDS